MQGSLELQPYSSYLSMIVPGIPVYLTKEHMFPFEAHNATIKSLTMVTLQPCPVG